MNLQRGNSRVVRALKGHHLLPVMLLIIPLRKAASVIQIHEHLPVLRTHMVSLPSFLLVKLRIFPVHGRNGCHVFRFFHPALYLEGIDSCLHKIGDDLKSTDVFRT